MKTWILPLILFIAAGAWAQTTVRPSSGSGSGGSATNAVSQVLTNGSVLGNGITSIDFKGASVTGMLSGAQAIIGITATGGGSVTTNANQFGATANGQLVLKDGFRGTNQTSKGDLTADNIIIPSWNGERVLISSTANEIAEASILSTELNHIAGLTANVQTNIDGKASIVYVLGTSNSLYSFISGGSQTPWGQTINGAGYALTNAGNLTSTGTVTAAQFVGSSTDVAGKLLLQATNPVGSLSLAIPATWRATNDISATITNPVAGQVLKISSVSGNTIMLTNDVPHPLITTNTVWVSAGAMAPGGGSTADGGRNGGTAGSITNGSMAVDAWLLDDTTNECVTFTFQPGYGFAGDVVASLYWSTTNAINGASNVVWDAGVSLLSSNGLFTANTYQTNGTFRFWSSNSVQVAKLPQITIASGVTPDTLLSFRLSRLGTNTADAALGDAQLLGARISFTRTNLIGGYP